MNHLFADLIVTGKVRIYLDDILIATLTIEEHRKLVKEVLKRLKDNDLYLNPEKCLFEQTRVTYLGVILSQNKVEMDPAKVEAIINWPTPTNASHIRKFKGFANFYRRFIQDFGKLCHHLDRLTSNLPWQWGHKEQEAFDKLKKAFTEYPVLHIYDHTKETRVETDASGYGTGAILSQKQEDDKWHPVAYLSQSMNETEQNYDIYDKELMAVIHALEAWRHYLEGLPNKFQILTDHKNLESWCTAQNITRRQARWSLFLSQFNFEMVHKPGKDHGAPDVLSRNPDHHKSDEEDNLGQVMLKPEHISISERTCSRDCR